MKLIIAVINPDRLHDVLRKLEENQIHLVTVSNAVGRGRKEGPSAIYRSHREAGNLLKKVRIEIAVNDVYVQPTVDAIVGGARSGEIGDGKIFILDLHECIRVRTGETGPLAIG